MSSRSSEKEAAANITPKMPLKSEDQSLSNQEQSEPSDFLAKKIRMATRGPRGKPLPEGYGRDNPRADEVHDLQEPNEVDLTDASLTDVNHVNEDKDLSPGAVPVAGIDALETSRAWQSHFDSLHDTIDQDHPSTTEMTMETKENLEVHNNNDQRMSSTSELSNQPVAIVVDENEWENEVREHILHDAAKAEIVTSSFSSQTVALLQRKLICSAVVIVLVLIALAIFLSVWFIHRREHDDNESASTTTVPSTAPTITSSPTLETIVENGVLRCAMVDEFVNTENKLCQAIAAAVLGNSSSIEKVTVEAGNPYTALTNMKADVAVTFGRFSMENSVFQKKTEVGFSFQLPWNYDGYSFGGEPDFVECGDKLDGFFGKCKKLRICVPTSESYKVVEEWFPKFIIRQYPIDEIGKRLKEGICNVAFGPRIAFMSDIYGGRGNNTSPFKTGSLMLSKVPAGTVTRKDDTEWSDFVYWIIQALFTASARNIDSSNASDFGTTQVFGQQFENMFVDAIGNVGNAGTIWDEETYGGFNYRDLNSITKLNNGSSGLIYSLPFGENTNSIGPAPQSGSTMYNILKQGYIRCGVMVENPEAIQDDWRNLGIEFCKALAAGLFQGNSSRIEIKNVSGYAELDRKEVDLISGGRVNLQTDVHEPTTKKGFTFSLPYFYDYKGLNHENPHRVSDSIALVTREDDYQFSDFVFWMVSATFFAEEMGISRGISFDMPLVRLFGESLEKMYRYAVSAVGNYGDMYNRTVTVPRSGQNLLNSFPFGPQINPAFWEMQAEV